jgi:membrane protein DedA with SNARE-associated domain
MLLQLVSRFGYVALFALLVGGGVGLPAPEELLQLSAGYLSEQGVLRFLPALVACYGGIVTGDALLFLLAQRHGESLLGRLRVDRLLTPRRRALLERHFARHAFLTIVVARHLSGFRIAAYVLAATHGVRARTFVLADALSAGASVPLVVGAGFLFAAKLEAVKQRIHDVQLLLAIAVVAGLVAWWGLRWWRVRRRARD